MIRAREQWNVRIAIVDFDFLSVSDEQGSLVITRDFDTIGWRGEINRRDAIS